MSDKMREAAEQAYTMTALDCASNPVGSRDWALFWRGWCAALAEQPAQGSTTQLWTHAQWQAKFCKHCGYDHSAGPLCNALKAEQPAQGEAVRAGTVRHTVDDGVSTTQVIWIGDKTRAGTAVYLAPPAPSVPDELREVIRDACREWQSYVEVDTAPMSCRDYVMREVDAWLAAAPEVPRG